MLNETRIRRSMKWTGVGACLVLVGLWVFSGWWAITYSANFTRLHFRIGIDGGPIWISVIEGPLDRDYETLAIRPTTTNGGPRPSWYPDLGFSWRRSVPGNRYSAIRLDALLFATLLAIPTIRLFWTGRRRVSAACSHCGYDLTATVLERCPECGRACSRNSQRETADSGQETTPSN
jgi:hypothetical protein